ncbi:MAG: hypothetical protein JSV90_05735 [Methanobacteriota archaeon]|nr:MAG: hypothetical protein JSV90_05735 [Euryarchaeota archaeon]
MPLVLLLVSSAQAASAAASSESDFWTYEVRTTISSIPVTGAVTYRIVGTQTSVVEGDEIDVDVLKVTGLFEGNVSADGLMRSTVGIFDGYRHEVRGTPAVILDDLTWLASLSEGYGEMQVSSSLTVWESVYYSPPLMYGIDIRAVGVGDTWDESTKVTRSLSVDDGSDEYDLDDVSVESISYTVVSTGVESTDAGDFSTVEILRTSSGMNETLWYAEDVGRHVRLERFEPGLEDPAYVAVLTDYSHDERSEDYDMIMLLSVALAVSLAVMVIVAVTVFARRRPKDAQTSEKAPDEAGVDGEMDEGGDFDAEKER